MTCPWCVDPDADEHVDTRLLCLGHLAEYEGLSVAELLRMEREQAAELREWAGA